MDRVKVTLDPDDLPKNWYNIQHDLPEPLPPPLDPGTMKPMSPEPLLRLFAKECVMQEVSTEEYIPIPEGSGRRTSDSAVRPPSTAPRGSRPR